MSEAIVISPSVLADAQITVAAEARRHRDELLERSATVVAVKDRLDADDATNVLRDLKAYSAAIEAARVSAKGPVLDVGRKIDALAKELAEKTTAEANRIAKVVGAFEAEERRKLEEARYQAELEARRIAAEAQREAAKARAAAPDALTADRASDAVLEKATEQVVAIRQEAAAVSTRQAGTQVRTEVLFEVEDIRALYAAHPELVTLEPNGTAIRAIIRANPNIQIQGLRHWREAKLNVR